MTIKECQFACQDALVGHRSSCSLPSTNDESAVDIAVSLSGQCDLNIASATVAARTSSIPSVART